MQAGISNRLKYIFLIHAIVGIIVGIGFLVIPDQLGVWFGAPFCFWV